jgi:hypothetical protein
MNKTEARDSIIELFLMIFTLFSRFLFLVPFFDGFVKSRERRPFRERGDPELPELLAAHNYIDVQNPIPPFSPFSKGCPASRGI